MRSTALHGASGRTSTAPTVRRRRLQFEGPRRPGGPVAAAAVAMLLLPLAVSAGVLLFRVGSGFHALSDQGLNEMHVRDVGRHLVLVGPYSRDGWNHFGPAMYYALAIPYRLTGSNSAGTYIGALVINAAAVAGIVLIAFRRGGIPVLLLTTLGLTLVMHNLGADFLRDPWNPYLPVLPFGLLIFLVWEMTAGSAWALPVAAAVATFVVQTHVGYVPLAIPLVLGGAVWLVVARRSGRADHFRAEPPDPFIGRTGAVIAVIVAVMWILPIIGAVEHTAGNIVDAMHYFLHPKGNHDVIAGYRVVAAQFGATADWITGAHAPNAFTAEPVYLSRSTVPWLAIPFADAVYVLWRRHRREGLELAAIVTVLLVLGVLAVTRTIGFVYEYRLRWTWLLGMVAMVLVGWAAWTMVERAPSFLPRWLVTGPVIVAIGALGIANTISAAHTSTPDKRESTILAKLVPPTIRALPSRRGVVIATTAPNSWFYASGLVLWLERARVPVRVPNTPDAEQAYDYARVYHVGPVRARVTLADGSDYDQLSLDPTERLVVYVGTRSPAQRRILLAQRAAVLDQARAGLLPKQSIFARVVQLNRQLGDADAVFIQRSSS